MPLVPLQGLGYDQKLRNLRVFLIGIFYSHSNGGKQIMRAERHGCMHLVLRMTVWRNVWVRGVLKTFIRSFFWRQDLTM
jgi:hypothetical protein